VVGAPQGDGYTRLQRGKHRLVEQFIGPSAVEALGEAILQRLAGRKRNAIRGGSDPPGKDGVRVNWLPLSLTIILGRPRSVMSRPNSRAIRMPERDVSTMSARLSRAVVDDGQDAKPSPVGELPY